MAHPAHAAESVILLPPRTGRASDLRAATGIAVGMGLSLLLWLGIGYGVYQVMH